MADGAGGGEQDEMVARGGVLSEFVEHAVHPRYLDEALPASLALPAPSGFGVMGPVARPCEDPNDPKSSSFSALSLLVSG